MLLYWGSGKEILARQREEGWGTKVIDRPANDLRREFPDLHGLSRRNLGDMSNLTIYSVAALLMSVGLYRLGSPLGAAAALAGQAFVYYWLRGARSRVQCSPAGCKLVPCQADLLPRRRQRTVVIVRCSTPPLRLRSSPR